MFPSKAKAVEDEAWDVLENKRKGKKARIVKYLKFKWMNPSIELRELVLDRVKFRNKALLKETLIIDDLEQN